MPIVGILLQNLSPRSNRWAKGASLKEMQAVNDSDICGAPSCDGSDRVVTRAQQIVVCDCARQVTDCRIFAILINRPFGSAHNSVRFAHPLQRRVSRPLPFVYPRLE